MCAVWWVDRWKNPLAFFRSLHKQCVHFLTQRWFICAWSSVQFIFLSFTFVNKRFANISGSVVGQAPANECSLAYAEMKFGTLRGPAFVPHLLLKLLWIAHIQILSLFIWDFRTGLYLNIFHFISLCVGCMSAYLIFWIQSSGRTTLDYIRAVFGSFILILVLWVLACILLG